MRRDLVFGSVTLALGASYYWLSDSIAISSLADAIGPRGLPKIYALALIGLSLILIVSSARPAIKSQSPNPKSQSGPTSQHALARAGGMLLIGVVYVLLVPYIGYMVSIAGVILATIYYQGGGWTRHAVVVALCGGVFFWLLFVVLMGIEQPPGFFPPQL
jgi:cell division protein FtsW (lipid II flippase)